MSHRFRISNETLLGDKSKKSQFPITFFIKTELAFHIAVVYDGKNYVFVFVVVTIVNFANVANVSAVVYEVVDDDKDVVVTVYNDDNVLIVFHYAVVAAVVLINDNNVTEVDGGNYYAVIAVVHVDNVEVVIYEAVDEEIRCCNCF